MTVGELKAILEHYPDDLELYADGGAGLEEVRHFVPDEEESEGG